MVDEHRRTSTNIDEHRTIHKHIIQRIAQLATTCPTNAQSNGVGHLPTIYRTPIEIDPRRDSIENLMKIYRTGIEKCMCEMLDVSQNALASEVFLLPSRSLQGTERKGKERK